VTQEVLVKVITRLWELAGEARFAAGMTAFKSSRTLAQSLAGWADMLPAMNPAERAAIFRGLKAGAPEAVFTAALRLAEQVLDERAWQTLKSSLETTSASSLRAA
jgi:hypothetical protein